MSTQIRNDDASDLQEEEVVARLEEEIERMAETILEYRTTLPDRLTSTLSSVLASQRPPNLPNHLGFEPETRMVTGPDSEAAGTSQGFEPETRMVTGPDSEAAATSQGLVTEDAQEAEKIQLLKEKILSNASTLPIVLNRMKEYMARIDKLEASNGTIHPVFTRKRTS